MKIRVLIAEDDQSIRKWYAYSLGSMEDIELLPMAENGYQAVASAVLYHPDVLILDMEMESRDAGLKAGQPGAQHSAGDQDHHADRLRRRCDYFPRLRNGRGGLPVQKRLHVEDP